MIRLIVMFQFLLMCGQSGRSLAGEYSGDPELLWLVQKATHENFDRLISWKGEAVSEFSSYNSSGRHVEIKRTASFVWDRDQDSLRYNRDYLERKSRNSLNAPFKYRGHRRFCGMETPKAFYEFAFEGDEANGVVTNSLVIWPVESEGKAKAITFDPFSYLKVKKFDGFIRNWGNPRDPNQSGFPFETSVSRVGQDIIRHATTFYQGEDSLSIVKEYDLAKGGNLVKQFTRGTGDNSISTLSYDYKMIRGIWIPTVYKRNDEPIDKTKPYQHLTKEVLEFTHHVINESVDPNEFTLEKLGVVKGTHVSDRIVGMAYEYDGVAIDTILFSEINPSSVESSAGDAETKYTETDDNSNTFSDADGLEMGASDTPDDTYAEFAEYQQERNSWLHWIPYVVFIVLGCLLLKVVLRKRNA